jgi:hypothetical protein
VSPFVDGVEDGVEDDVEAVGSPPHALIIGMKGMVVLQASAAMASRRVNKGSDIAYNFRPSRLQSS